MKIPLADLPSDLRRLALGERGLGTTFCVEEREVGFPNEGVLAELMAGFGFVHFSEALHAISRGDAAALIAHLSAYDQAYGSPTKALSIADNCGDQFVGLFEAEARFFTNSLDRIDASARSWSSFTDSTMDAGVLAVSPTRVGVVWFEDED